MNSNENNSKLFAVYKDVSTKLPIEGSPPGMPDVVHLDSPGFGAGCCSLQVTYQACSMSEARILYDNLGPLCPILLALTAASPIFRGYLTESDCRWNIIRDAFDCRTSDERCANNGDPMRRRYDSINCYLSQAGEK